MARMTQSEIINALADSSGLKKAEVKGLFDSIADLAAREVRANGEFTLPGFGKLVKATRKAREGRNPATGAVIQIPSKTTVKFRLGKSMKDAVGK
jgi:DNA-binding protein HU-beta